MQLSYEEYAAKEKPKSRPFSLLLDGIQNPQNLGLITRTAVALNVGEIFLRNSEIDPRAPGIERISRNTQSYLTYKSWEDSDTELWEYYSIALELSLESELLYEKDFSEIHKSGKPLLLIGGNERKGTSQEILQRADCSLHLPQVGPQSSINLAVAMSSAMHWLWYCGLE